MDGELIMSFAAGSSVSYQGTGWSYPEAEMTWTLGPESTIILPRPSPAGDYRLQLRVRPFLPAGRSFMRLGLSVNGQMVGRFVVREPAVLDCWLPWSLIGGPATMILILEHPDATRPCDVDPPVADDRQLSLAFEAMRLSLLSPLEAARRPAPGARAEADALQAVLMDCESLGYNCELGMVQRQHGAEPLGLLRFGYSPLDSVVRGLDDGFTGFDAPERIEVALDPVSREYVVRDHSYGFEWHSWVHEGQADPAALGRQWRGRLPFLARKLLEVIEEDAKLLVVTDEAGPTDPARIARLQAALGRHGAPTLLWLGVADAAHPAGTVQWAGKRLIRGWLSRLTPRMLAISAEMEEWAVIVPRAYTMWKEGQGSALDPSRASVRRTTGATP